MDKQELLPCPFCGGEAAAYPQTCRQNDPEKPYDRAFPIVRCKGCFSEVGGDNFPSVYGEVSSAIRNWNARATPTREQIAGMVKPLAEAMQDLLGEARGIVPESAGAFYDYQRGEFTARRILAALGMEGG